MSVASDKISKALARAMHKHTFFATIAYTLPFVETTALMPPTMATDMRNIYYHPQFVEEHSIQELVAVIIHEVLHVAWLHGLRRGARDPLIWNYAGDYAINPTVVDAGLLLPSGCLYDDKYRNMTAEAIYEDLIKNAQTIKFKMPSMDGSDDGQECEVLVGGVLPDQGKDENGNDIGKMSEADMKQLEAEIKLKVAAAADAAKKRGNLPAGVEGLVEAVGKPKINWHEYIQNWVRGHTPDDYSWCRPNRRMLANHRVYMPSVECRGAGVGLLSIDTSGSVSNEELVKYITEIVGVIEMCKPDRLIIIQHDAIIQRIDEWEAGMDFSSLAIKGRGGTCIRPSFKYADEIGEPVDWMICFTDMGIGDYPQPKDAPYFPVLWAATGPDNAPFGTYIPIKDAI